MEKCSKKLTSYYQCSVKLLNLQESSEQLAVKVEVTNTGSLPWFCKLDEEFFLGYLLKDAYTGVVLMEGRHKLDIQRVEPGASASCDFCVPLAHLARTDYNMSVDMVREHHFWFAELGQEALEIAIGQV